MLNNTKEEEENMLTQHCVFCCIFRNFGRNDPLDVFLDVLLENLKYKTDFRCFVTVGRGFEPYLVLFFFCFVLFLFCFKNMNFFGIKQKY